MATTVSTGRLEGRRTDKFVYLRLAALVLLWGANWTLMKSVFGYMSAPSFILWRFCGAAVVMAAITIPLRQPLLPVRGERTRLAIIGIVQIALCLGVSTYGLQFLGAGRAAVLIYTMQLWSLPLGWLIAGERITGKAWLGGLIVFSGLLIFLNPSLVNWHDPKVLLGNALLLLSAICWALGSCLYRRCRWQTSFWSQTLWQVLWSGVVIGLAIPLFGPRRPVIWNPVVVGVLIYNWLGTTVLCYLWWGKILSVMRASRAGQFLAVTPVAAVLISSALTHERVTVSIALSIVLISGGICLAVRGR